jgi:hypothetical protein
MGSLGSHDSKERQMRSKEELTSLFTTYFSDRLSPSQVDTLVSDVLTAAQNRRVHTFAATQANAARDQALQQMWSSEFA